MAHVEEWPASGFEATLRARERVLVLFDASWCEPARRFRPLFEAAEPESPVPLARAPLARALDPRWDAYGIRVVPTLVYYEHGEELERVDGLPGTGLSARDLDDLLVAIDGIQQEPILPRWMHGPRPR